MTKYQRNSDFYIFYNKLLIIIAKYYIIEPFYIQDSTTDQIA